MKGIYILDRKFFVCGFCGNEYSNIKDRMKCENDCLAKETRMQQQREREELAKNKKTRQDELTNIENQIKNLCKTYDEKAKEYIKSDRGYEDYSIPIYKLSDSQLVKNIFDTLRL